MNKEKIVDPEDEVITNEFETLMKQRKALEEEINELKQLQDLACQKSPLTQRTKTVETELEMKYDLWRSLL